MCDRGGPLVVLITTRVLDAAWRWAHRCAMSGFFERTWQKGWDKIEERRRELQEQDACRRLPKECGWTREDQAADLCKEAQEVWGYWRLKAAMGRPFDFISLGSNMGCWVREGKTLVLM